MWTGALRGEGEADGETAGGERERGGLNGRSDDDVALSPLSMGELARPPARQPRFIAKTIMRLLFLARTSVPSQQFNAMPKLPMSIKVFELAFTSWRCRWCLSLCTLWLSAG